MTIPSIEICADGDLSVMKKKVSMAGGQELSDTGVELLRFES